MSVVPKFCPSDKIKATWERLRRDRLPAWDDLPPAMREALILMWAGGEKHALEVTDAIKEQPSS